MEVFVMCRKSAKIGETLHMFLYGIMQFKRNIVLSM